MFGCKSGKPCIIKDNTGGSVAAFLEAADSVSDSDFVHIDGYCYSACALFADYARPRVCVTDKAVFGFHKAFMVESVHDIYFNPQQSKDLALWIYAHEDFPNTSLGAQLLLLSYPDTLRFWPRCPTQTVAERGDRLERGPKKLTLIMPPAPRQEAPTAK